MDRIIYLDGKKVDTDKVFISIFDRGFQFGDSVYEVIRCYNGVPFLLEEHIRRLQYSLNELRIPLPEPREAIIKLCESAAAELDAYDSTIYIQVTRGMAQRSYYVPQAIKPTFILYCEKYNIRPQEVYKKGIEVSILPDIRWQRCDIKTTSLVASVLQKENSKNSGADDVLLEKDGLGVVESGSGNLFIVKDGSIKTTPEGHWILSGTARGLTIRIIGELDLPLKEAFISREELTDADEVFITSTTAEVLPVVCVDKHLIKDGMPGPIAAKLLGEYRDRIYKATGYRYDRE